VMLEGPKFPFFFPSFVHSRARYCSACLHKLGIMEKIKTVSAFNRRVLESDRVVLPLGTLPSWGTAIESLMHLVSGGFYDDEGNEIEGEERLMEEDIPFDSVPGVDSERATAGILSMGFEIEQTGDMPDDVVKALNTHIVTAVSVLQPSFPKKPKILVLCAGNGEDLNRLSYQSLVDASAIHLVGASGLTPRASFVLENVKDKLKATTEYLHNVPKGFLLPTYDIIICHHGLHHVMSTHGGEAAFLSLLNRLSPNGRFIGDKVDLMGLDTLQKFSSLPSHSVELMHLDRSVGIEGVMTIRVAGKTWRDPILSDRRLLDLVMSEGSPFTVHMLQGRHAFKSYTLEGYPFTPPKTVDFSSRRAETRVITYIEIARKKGVSCPVHKSFFPSFVWEERKSFSDQVSQLFEFPINRGKHFQAKDVPYLSYGYSIFSEKTNGHSARVVVGEGSAYMEVYTSPVKYYLCQLPSRHGLPLLRLQCEYLPDGSVVVLDPIHLGIDTPSGFQARLRHMDSIFSISPYLDEILVRKEWYPSLPFEEARAGEWEGVVIMPSSAPSPRDGVRFESTALYSKWDPTVDVATPDGVVEVCVDSGKIVRPRPDKKVGNSEKNVAEVKASIRLVHLDIILRVEYDEGIESKGLRELRECMKIVPSDGLMMSLRYPSRMPRDPELRELKSMFLETVGFSPPQVVGGLSLADPGTSWEMDIGLEGGGGNSKGDGPRQGFGRAYAQHAIKLNVVVDLDSWPIAASPLVMFKVPCGLPPHSKMWQVQTNLGDPLFGDAPAPKGMRSYVMEAEHQGKKWVLDINWFPSSPDHYYVVKYDPRVDLLPQFKFVYDEYRLLVAQAIGSLQ